MTIRNIFKNHLKEDTINEVKKLEDKVSNLKKDISERKNAEQMLVEREARYRSLIMNLHECFVYSQVVFDEEGNPTDLITLEGNYAFFNIIGLTAEEVIGKSAFKTSPFLKSTTPDFLGICGNVALTGERVKFEMQIEEIRVWVDVSVFSPAKGYIISIFSDITEKKLAEEEIRTLTSGIEQSPSAVVITNTLGEIEYINPKFTELTGYTREEAMGKNPDILKSGIHPDELYDDLWNSIRKGEVWRGELLNKKKNGDLYWINISISPIRNNKGEIIHYVAIHEDITYKKTLQQKLEENNRMLEEALEKLKLTQAQLIQNEKMAGIGQLAAGIAHEINNPLGFIISNFNTLQKYTGKFKETLCKYRNLINHLDNNMSNSIDYVVQYLKDVEMKSKIDFIFEDLEDLYKDTDDGFNRIGGIVSSLRNFSHVDIQNSFLKFDLNEGIRNTLVVANNEIKYNSKVELYLENIPSIYANGGEINQVLLNIMINAVHAIKAKESGEMGTIKISTSHDKEYVFCNIEDNGVGVKKENLIRIFDPFFTTKKVGEGTGLGLSISYDIIVNKHNGELSVGSTPGLGTRFTIKLPIKGEDVISEE